jgi:IMP dehydrogenase
MALVGGLGIIHRYMSVDNQVEQVRKVKRFLQYIIDKPYTINVNAVYNDVVDMKKKYNVSTFCVVDDNNKIMGLITNRDISYMEYLGTNPLIMHYMTIYASAGGCAMGSKDNLVVIYATDDDIKTRQTDLLLTGKRLMMKHRYEKIPIVHVYNGSLLGLLTLKNIKHWENNKTKACLDSNGALCVGAGIGIVDDYMERLDRLVEANVDLVCVDVANGYNSNVVRVICEIRAKYPKLILMVGNVCNSEGYLAMCAVDIDCIRIGVGNGSICTTRLETGIGIGQFTAVSSCYKIKKAKGTLPHIISDGGSLGKTGNKVKALACGATAIILGRTLASTEESPGNIIYRNGKRFKYIRGMASTMANISKQENMNKRDINTNFTAEGVDGEQELTGPVINIIEQINGGIRSGLSYLGVRSIGELHERQHMIKFNLVSSIGMTETNTRIKNY